MIVSVVIVAFRTPDETVAAVRSSLASASDQVVVVDNASGDRTIESLNSLADARISVLENRSNDGFGMAANRGARESAGDVLIFLNSDAQLSRVARDELVAELARWEGFAIVGARLVGTDGSIQRSAGLLPKSFDLAIRALGFHAIAGWVGGFPAINRVIARSGLAREYASAETATEPIDTSMVSGACFAIGRAAFEDLGGFDERFFMYFEDADLCRRARAAGIPVRYVPAAVVRHIGGASSSEDYHFGPLHARSMRQYLGKWSGLRGSGVALLVLWLRAIGFSVAMRPGASRAWRALWAAARDEDPRR